MAGNAADAKAVKAVEDAEKGMDGVLRAIEVAFKMLKRGEVDPKKALIAAKKLKGFIGEERKTGDMASGPAGAQMSDAVCELVAWMGGLVDGMIAHEDDLKKARKQAKLGEAADLSLIGKLVKRLYLEAPAMPKPVKLVIRAIRRGEAQLSGEDGVLVSLMPLILVLAIAQEVIEGADRSRPKMAKAA